MNRSTWVGSPAMLLACVLAGCCACGPKECSRDTECGTRTGETMDGKVLKTDEEWRSELTPEQYRIMREKGTETAFTGAYWNLKAPGVYHCAACGLPLFGSEAKFDAGCGWPSFSSPVEGANVEERVDSTLGMRRTEVLCARCSAHLGHVFPDGPAPTGLRYCINSAALEFEKKE